MTSRIEASGREKDIESVKKELFRSVTRGEWKKVVAMYQKDPRARMMQITRSGHTALHLAVSDAEEKVVEELVRAIEGSKEALRIGDERGHTPLHFAAAIGNCRMCECIASVEPSLVGARNNKGETPLFWAVLYGQRDAFFCLNSRCRSREEGYFYCRRSEDGETILHCAIFSEDFELAFDIIHLYDKLVNLVDEQGFSPLHTLASKASCFKSGATLGRWERIIYDGVIVDRLKIRKYSGPKVAHRYPENYETCVNFFVLLKTAAIRVATVIGLVKRTNARTDIENGIEQENANAGDVDDSNNLNDACCDNAIGSNDGSSSSNYKSTIYQPDAIQQMNVTRQSCTHKKDDDNPHPYDFRSLHRRQSSSGARMPLNFNVPANYVTFFEFVSTLVNAAMKAIIKIFGWEHTWITTIIEEKQKHVWAVQIVDELLKHSTMYDNVDRGAKPNYEAENHDYREFFTAINNSCEGLISTVSNNSTVLGENNKEKILVTETRETAILIAAKYGVSEIVDRILQHFPAAIHDADQERKNVLLLAAENRQLEVYKLLLNRNVPRGLVMRKVDNQGNTALHFAAMFGENSKPWPIPGDALQMQWEIKWYKFVENSMPPRFFARPNKEGKTPELIFSKTHKDLVKAGGKWLTSTSSACFVVATLITTVAFASATTFPGGTNEKSGKPTLENRPTFNLFMASSVIALCFSVTALVLFLAILTSRYQEKDFGMDLPMKILLGLTSLFISIIAMLTSFCSGHFFVLEDKLKFAASLVYVVTFLPISLFAAAQFPLYIDLVRATFWSPF